MFKLITLKLEIESALTFIDFYGASASFLSGEFVQYHKKERL
jgi:hypothetical protein